MIYIPNDVWNVIKTYLLYSIREYKIINDNRYNFYVRKLWFGVNLIQNKILNKKLLYHKLNEYEYIFNLTSNSLYLQKVKNIIWKYKICKVFDSIRILTNKYKYPKNELELLNFRIDIDKEYRSSLSKEEIINIINNEISNEHYEMKIELFREEFLKNTKLVYL